jgi:hypothetical protein
MYLFGTTKYTHPLGTPENSLSLRAIDNDRLRNHLFGPAAPLGRRRWSLLRLLLPLRRGLSGSLTLPFGLWRRSLLLSDFRLLRLLRIDDFWPGGRVLNRLVALSQGPRRAFYADGFADEVVLDDAWVAGDVGLELLELLEDGRRRFGPLVELGVEEDPVYNFWSARCNMDKWDKKG